MGIRVAIVGASGRAAAFSALRAGLTPFAADLFADPDLRRRALVTRVEHYPEGLATALSEYETDGWFYTGGIENYPELVDRIAAKRPLWGNPGATLQAVRDPFRVAEMFREEGIACPPLATSPDGLPADGSWLRKPLYGSGGSGIRVWRGPWPPADGTRQPAIQTPTGGTRKPRGETVPHFYQRRIGGVPCSAVFVAAGGRSAYLGATWQLVGTAWTGAGEFGYAGSIGPLPPQPHFDRQWERIGAALARRFRLVGLFGVDAILDGPTVWPIEINPRYPASAEVLERGLGVETVRMHLDACQSGRLPESLPRAGSCWCGKAVLYAAGDMVVPPQFERFAQEESRIWPWPNLADVPEAGTLARAGTPVTTVLAEGPDEATLRSTLRCRAEKVQRLLDGVKEVP